MTEMYFISQIDRLKRRFGERHFDPEFVKLCALESHTMSDLALQRAVDVWIGNRSHNKPPLLSDFREVRLSEEKLRMNRDINHATSVIKQGSGGLKSVLKDQFDNVGSAWEGVELLKFKTKLKKAEDPDGVA